jgi:hypothetical protein
VNPELVAQIPPRRLRWRECLGIILYHGSTLRHVSAFEIAEFYGPEKKNQFVCMAGYLIAGFRGYARLYSEGWYLLTKKGEKHRSGFAPDRSTSPHDDRSGGGSSRR